MMDPSELPPTGPLAPKGHEVVGQYADGVLHMRDLRVKAKYDRQVKLYSPCSCGSGKKHKFCCNGKEMVVINTGV